MQYMYLQAGHGSVIHCMYFRPYIDMQQMFRYGLVYKDKQCKYTAFVHMHLQEKITKKRLKLKA